MRLQGAHGNRQMLKHGRAGVPMEVMGLMLGEFIDDTTVSHATWPPCSMLTSLLDFGKS